MRQEVISVTNPVFFYPICLGVYLRYLCSLTGIFICNIKFLIKFRAGDVELLLDEYHVRFVSIKILYQITAHFRICFFNEVKVAFHFGGFVK